MSIPVRGGMSMNIHIRGGSMSIRVTGEMAMSIPVRGGSLSIPVRGGESMSISVRGGVSTNVPVGSGVSIRIVTIYCCVYKSIPVECRHMGPPRMGFSIIYLKTMLSL